MVWTVDLVVLGLLFFCEDGEAETAVREEDRERKIK